MGLSTATYLIAQMRLGVMMKVNVCVERSKKKTKMS